MANLKVTEHETYRFYYMHVMILSNDVPPAAAKHLDNDHSIVVDGKCYADPDNLPKYLPALGEVITLADTGTDLDGMAAVVIGYRTRAEMEGG